MQVQKLDKLSPKVEYNRKSLEVQGASPGGPEQGRQVLEVPNKAGSHGGPRQGKTSWKSQAWQESPRGPRQDKKVLEVPSKASKFCRS